MKTNKYLRYAIVIGVGAIIYTLYRKHKKDNEATDKTVVKTEGKITDLSKLNTKKVSNA